MITGGDFIFDFKGFGNCESRCRVRIYRINPHGRERTGLLQQLHTGDAVIILSQLNDAGTSVTNASELIAHDLYEQMRLAGHPLEPLRTVWIEHYPRSYPSIRSRSEEETFDRVTYGAFVPSMPRPMFREARWNRLTREIVAELIGEEP